MSDQTYESSKMETCRKLVLYCCILIESRAADDKQLDACYRYYYYIKKMFYETTFLFCFQTFTSLSQTSSTSRCRQGLPYILLLFPFCCKM